MSKSTKALFVLASALIFLCLAITSQAAPGDKLTVRVMTRNMDAGTDLIYVAGATDEASFAAAVYQTYAEILAFNLPARAAQLAEEIAAAQPDQRSHSITKQAAALRCSSFYFTFRFPRH